MDEMNKEFNIEENEPAKAPESYKQPANEQIKTDSKNNQRKRKTEDDDEISIPSLLFDIVETLSIATCAVVLLFVSLFRIAVVSGPSMQKTLFDGDVLIVSDIAFEPKYGDIVVFQKLDSRLKEEAVVKRVIATEGQTVDIDFDTWTVYVDNVAIDESKYLYLAPDAKRTTDIDFPITLSEGQLFVMGDNRNHSTDSRESAVGLIDERTVFGRVIMRISPLSEFEIFERFK